MPYSVNGFGTGLVPASRKRTLHDYTQFDALEAVTFAYLPIVPYRALHVLGIWQDPKRYEAEQYQSAPLRMAGRLVIKAYLNRWGTILGLFGAALLLLAIFASATMSRPFARGDAIFMAISATMTVVGLLFKLAWLFLNQPDERIKDILGPHGLGTSDPYYWPRDVALASIEQLVGDGSDGSLLEIAQRANAQGDRGKAMLCTRLAMQLAQSLEAQDLLRRLLRGE